MVGRIDVERGTQAQAIIAIYAISKIFSFYTSSLQGLDGQMSEMLR